MLYTLRFWLFRAAVWILTLPVKMYVLEGGRAPEPLSDGAIGYDAYARAIVSPTEDDGNKDPLTPTLRKLRFDFEHIPEDGSEDEKWIREHIAPERDEDGYLVFIMQPREQVLIGVGFVIEMPQSMFHWVAPRSGLAAKDRMQVTNAPGTVDSDYRGEAGVALKNDGDKPFHLKRHMRIAQLIFQVGLMVEIKKVNTFAELTPSKRGAGGFGSTGKEANKPKQIETARR